MSSSPVNPRPPSDLLAPQTSLDLKKKEINKQFDSLHTKLQEKQVSIISSLESKYAPSTGSEYDRLNTQLQKLYASKEGLEQTMRDPNLSKISHTLQQSLDSLNQDIKKLEEILNPEVSLVWNIESCKSAIDKVCQVKTDSKYNSTDQPLFSGVKIGTGIDDVSQPKSLAIAANNIYILDDRFVHFYNEKGQRMYKFPLPVFKDSNLDSYYLTYEGGYIYVAGTKDEDICIIKINPVNGETKFQSLDILDYIRSCNLFYRSSININNLSIYAMVRDDDQQWNEQRITIYIYHKLRNLILTKQIFSDNKGSNAKNFICILKSPHINDNTTVISMKVVVHVKKSDYYYCGSTSKTDLYLLLRGSEYCVQLFNDKGVLVRAVIQLELSSPLSSFTIDKDENIIICQVKVEPPNQKCSSFHSLSSSVSISSNTTMDIYSNSGELQHVIKYSTQGITSSSKNCVEKLFLCVSSMYKLILLNSHQDNNILQII